jgi:hypothetical protein
VLLVRAGGEPLEWEPPEPTPETGYDVRYWGLILAEARKRITTARVRFVLTFRRDEIPIDGADVVVFAVGDDDARVPVWTTRVLATFKAMGVRPQRPPLPLRHPGASATALGMHARARLRGVPGLAARARVRARTGHDAPVYELPLGYHTQLALPLKPITERRYAMSFAGSVRHWRGWWGGFTSRMAPPKVFARRRMLEALDGVRRQHPELPVHVHLEPAFYNVSPVTGRYDPKNALGYSESVMETRLLLAPQGTNPETSRHFAGLRAGCVVVTDVVPDRWYFRGAPFVVVPGWRALERTVVPLLEDSARLEQMQCDSLRWWRERCAEEPIGRWVAERVEAAVAQRHAA